MKKINKQYLLFIIGIIFMFLLINNIYNNKIEEIEGVTTLYETAMDSLKHYKDKEGKNIAKIAVLETFNTKTLLKLKSNDTTINKLKNLIRKNRKVLKRQGSSTVIISNTNIDTVIKTVVSFYKDSLKTVKKDSLKIYPIYNASVVNKWYKLSSKSTKDSTSYKISIYSNLSIVIGREKKGLFKKSKPFAIASDENPYTNIKDMRVYQVKLPKPKRIGLGVYGGYGVSVIDSKINTGFQIGIGITYNFIQW